MADPFRWIDVIEDDAGLTMARRLPRLTSVVTVSFVATGAVLAAVPGLELPGWAVVFGTTILLATLPMRVHERAQRPLARWFRRRIVITPGCAGVDYRDAGRAGTITVDGRARPLADLRREAVGRQMMAVDSGDGAVSNAVTAAMVALIFDNEAVLVAFKRTDEEALALAGRVAHLAGREVVRLPDAVFSCHDPRRRAERGNAFQRVVSLEGWRHMAHYAGHLSRAGATAFGLFTWTIGLTVLVAPLPIADVVAAAHAERWVAALASLAPWVLADAVLLRGGAALVRDATQTRPWRSAATPC